MKKEIGYTVVCGWMVQGYDNLCVRCRAPNLAVTAHPPSPPTLLHQYPSAIFPSMNLTPYSHTYEPVFAYSELAVS